MKGASNGASPLQRGPYTLRESHFHIAFLLLLPYILFWINRNWTFQGLGHMDNWYYFGSFIHFPHYQRLIPVYPGERVAWLLPGKMLTWLVSAPYGGMLLNFLCYSFALVLVYLIVMRFCSPRSAFLTACLLGCNPCYIGANGWNYLSGGSNVYMLLAYFVLIRSSRSVSSLPHVVVAGASWAALINCYIAWVIFTPVCLLMYLAGLDRPLRSWVSKQGFVSLLRPGAYFAVGFTGAAIAMGVVYTVWVRGKHLFFEKNILAAASLSQMKQNPWSQGNFDWIRSASWIVMPVIVSVLLIGVVVFQRRRVLAFPVPVAAIIVSFFYSFFVMVVMTIRKSRLLEFEYFAEILLPIAFVALGVVAVRVPTSVGFRTWLLVTVGAVTVTSGALWKPGLYGLLLGREMLYPYLVLLVGVVIWLARPWRLWSWALLIALLSIGGFSLVPSYTIMAYRDSFDGLGAYTRVARAVQAIHKRYIDGGYPAFWIDNQKDTFTTEYRAIMCAFVSHHYSMQSYPQIDKGRSYEVGSMLVLITQEREVFKEANRLMSAAGMPLAFVGQDEIVHDGKPYYWITYVRVKKSGFPAAEERC